VRVVSREIGEEFRGCLVVEAFEPRLVVSVDDVVEEGIAVGVGEELVLSLVPGGSGPAGDGLGEPAVEAFDHAVGLGMERAGEAVLDAMVRADPVEGVASAGAALPRPAGASETVGELGAVVGEDGDDLVREDRDEAFEAAGDGLGVTRGDDLDVDEAGGAVDGDEDVARFAFEAGQVLEIDVDEADAGGLEGAGRWPRRLRPGGDAVSGQAAMDGAARELVVDAAAHDLDDVVERQVEPGAQFDHQLLLCRVEARREAMGRVRAIDDPRTRSPAPDRRLADAEFRREGGHAGLARLDIGSRLRRRRRIGVKLQIHPRRSLT
jgi:hypothetical protein